MNGPKSIGTPKGTSIVLQGKKPILVANRAIPQDIAELKINGIANVGFSTKGKPKTTGSLILKIPGKNPNFAIILWSSLFENKNIAIIRDKTIPAPPGTIKFIQNPYVTGWVGICPALTAATLAATAAAIKGFLINW